MFGTLQGSINFLWVILFLLITKLVQIVKVFFFKLRAAAERDIMILKLRII